MRKNQCLFCTSRKCNNRVVSLNDNGATYDEVACGRHGEELYKHSDKVAPGVMKQFIDSTGNERRGDPVIKNQEG